MQVPPVRISFASLLSLSLVPTASHCSVNTCPPRVDGMSPAHLTSDTLMTLKEQLLSIAAPQPPFPVREQLLTKDSISCAEKLFTDKLQRGWRISQWPPCLRLGWGPGELLSCQSEDWVFFCFVGCSVSPLRGDTWRESTISRGDAGCPECLILLVSVFETSRVCGIYSFVAYCHGSMGKESVWQMHAAFLAVIYMQPDKWIVFPFHIHPSQTWLALNYSSMLPQKDDWPELAQKKQ